MAEFKKLINPPIKASDINSESATNGQVLTANGTGGATWQDAKGTEVVANPVLAGTETDLTGLEVAGTKYKVPTGGGTEVVANPALAGTESDLTGLEVAGTKYKVPSGGTQLYKHNISVYTNDGYNFGFSLYTTDSYNYDSYSQVCTYMFEHGSIFYMSGIYNEASNRYPLIWIVADGTNNMEFHYLVISPEGVSWSSMIVGTDIVLSIDDSVSPL